MAFVGPWEIALILIVVILFFGARKLPELAKSIGEVVKQYRSASGSTAEGSQGTTAAQIEEQRLLETAKKLGIETKGRTIQEISDEILKRAK